MSSYLLLPHILHPTIVRGSSKTLINNIFSNAISPNILSGNLRSSISDRLPKFLVAHNMFFNSPSSKTKIGQEGWTKFEQDNFILDSFSINWDQTLCIYSNDKFLDKTNSLLDLYTTRKKILKNKLKFRDIQWITPGIQKSISIINHYI